MENTMFDINNEYLELKSKFENLNDAHSLMNIIKEAQTDIDEWKVSTNKNKYDSVPIIPELLGYSFVEDDIGLEDTNCLSSTDLNKNSVYKYGFKKNQLTIEIPPSKGGFENIISCYQYGDGFFDKLTIDSARVTFDNEKLTLCNHSNARLASVIRTIRINSNDIITVSVNLRSKFTVFIYHYENDFITEVERIELNNDMEIEFKNKYFIKYSEGKIFRIVDSHNIETYSDKLEFIDIKIFFNTFLKYLGNQGFIKLNQLLLKTGDDNESLNQVIEPYLKILNFEELEELLETLYPIYSLPKRKEVLTYIQNISNLRFYNWEDFENFLINLQNTTQNIIDGS